MAIISIKSTLLIFIVTVFFQSNLFGQQRKEFFRIVDNAEELYNVVDSIISSSYYENVSIPLKVAFIFKVDSLGEIHSVHIGRSTNLKYAHYYDICNEIESNYRMKFLFEEFKDADRIGNYVRCNYLFQSPRSLPNEN
ncbi:MAG: hypothetical protein K0B10_06935 [Vicingaceae bacterium]|nr:hypothetical protein [Vicingaceae bacterium]